MGIPITPEQARALRVFESSYPEFEALLFSDDTLFTIDNICITNQKFFSYVPLKTKTLPRGTDWLWNQSRSRVRLTLDNGLNLIFYKLNTRKVRQARNEPPNYKIWVFNATSPDHKSFSFFWCERGEDMMEIEIKPVTLSDLSFLLPYASPACALLCGWK